jgi:nicotinate-nucleotide--dimethylbenzimidazole phosphoribosyltransferase
MQFDQLLASIQPLDEASMQAARLRQNVLTNPQGCLGRLEELSIQVADVSGKS